MTEPVTIKDIADFNPTRPLSKGTAAPFIDMAALPTNGRDISQIAQREYDGGGAKFRNGDTLFARKTPCLENGKTAKVSGLNRDEVGHGSTEFIVISAKEPKYDEDFIYYLARLPEFRTYAEKRMEGTSGRQRVSWQSIRDFPLSLPSKFARAEIGNILASIDDKIELNQRMNETLEAMARVLFKSWFVDFDPVRAKAEGRKPEGMDAATAALFPAAFNDDGLPDGWQQTTLDKIADLNSESWGNANHPDDVEYVDLANTKWGTIESTQHFSWNDAPSRARRVLRPGDTIVGTVRPGNGSFSFIGSAGLTGSTGFAVLRPKKEIYREAVCYATTSKDNIDRLAHLADGGAYPAVRPDVVLSMPLIFPGDKILAEYSQSTAALLDRVENNKQENRTLASLRDTLLPKLISSELRIDEAQGKRGK